MTLKELIQRLQALGPEFMDLDVCMYTSHNDSQGRQVEIGDLVVDVSGSVKYTKGSDIGVPSSVQIIGFKFDEE